MREALREVGLQYRAVCDWMSKTGIRRKFQLQVASGPKATRTAGRRVDQAPDTLHSMVLEERAVLEEGEHRPLALTISDALHVKKGWIPVSDQGESHKFMCACTGHTYYDVALREI